MIERTRMFSVRPGTPGRRQQNPRMMRSMGTPAWDASHRASIMSGSSSWFILTMMRRGLAGALVLDLAMDQFEQPRPHGERSNQQRVEVRLVGMTGKVVEQIDDILSNADVTGE